MTPSVALKGPGFWAGGDWREALRMLEACVRAGMTPGRALSIAHVASRRDNYERARKLARRAGVALRTFQRAIAQAKSLGFIQTFMGGKTERPPGAKEPHVIRWCHRITVGRGLPPEERVPVVQRARLTWNIRLSRRQQKPVELVTLAEQRQRMQPRTPPPGVSVLDWLNAQLEQLNSRPARDGPEE